MKVPSSPSSKPPGSPQHPGPVSNTGSPIPWRRDAPMRHSPAIRRCSGKGRCGGCETRAMQEGRADGRAGALHVLAPEAGAGGCS